MADIVECPNCALRFEPYELTLRGKQDVFCPQCGNRFDARKPEERDKAA